jgi:hypothetical protein
MPTELSLSNGLIVAVEVLSEAFDSQSIRYALIGDLGTAMRGYCPFGLAAEFLLDVPQVALPGLLDDLVERGFSLDPSVVIREYVRQHITSFWYGAIRIQWLKPVLPLYSRALADAAPLEWTEGHTVQVATAEGLILTKIIAFRTQDQMDIETLLTANRDEIDLDLIREEWSRFAATEPERTAWLEAAIARWVIRRE